MKKIPSLFQRNYGGDNLVRDEVVPGSEWVLAGEGVATRKWDGTAVLIQNGLMYKRYDAKVFTLNRSTGEKTPYSRKSPNGFVPAQDPDPVTGHWPGWVPVSNERPEDRWHREAFDRDHADGTY